MRFQSIQLDAPSVRRLSRIFTFNRELSPSDPLLSNGLRPMIQRELCDARVHAQLMVCLGQVLRFMSRLNRNKEEAPIECDRRSSPRSISH